MLRLCDKIVITHCGEHITMNYGIIAAAVTVFAIVTAGCYANDRGKSRMGALMKVLSVLLFVVLAVRVLSYHSGLDFVTLHTVTGDSLTEPTLSKGKAVVAFLTEWFSVASAVLLCLKAFYNIKTVDRLVLFVLPVYAALALVGLNWTIVESFGSGANELTFTSVAFATELGFSIYLIAYYWVQAISEKQIPLIKGWKPALYFVLALVLCSVVAMPNFWYPFLFNANRITANFAKDLLFYQRLLLYGSIALPVGAYFALRHRGKEVIHFTLTYFSLAAMLLYCYDITFVKMIEEPTSWPLHLCNTAMFLVPLCLVFRAKKLFYFTYFINVFGALCAMLMPNYEETKLLFSSGIFAFWYNHYVAFFMPLLLVALKVYERPTMKQFKYSMIGFCMYFVFALVVNVVLRAFGHETDYFFLVGDHIANTLGNWAKAIYSVTWSFDIAGKTFVLRPVYQPLFFVVYVGAGLAMWFIYELGFSVADAAGALTERRKKIKLDEIALASALGDRSIEEPMNKEAGIKLELKHFSKRYSTSKNYAVNDANLEVYGGEIFGFLGPNGAGKSTIIKSIVGIQPITEGAIEVCGYDCEKQPVQAKRLIGYVPDHYALYEKLTGREYINYIADIYDVSKEDRTERIERHIKMFELEGAIDNPIKTYSHGMKQKITIMAALVHDPKLWILDEPLTGLDPNSIHQVKECMKEHAAKGNIVFFSSHIIDVVERICDRITIIKKGKILVTKDVKDIESEGLLEDYYLKTIGGESDAK